jgi:hypothetical protein
MVRLPAPLAAPLVPVVIIVYDPVRRKAPAPPRLCAIPARGQALHTPTSARCSRRALSCCRAAMR